MDKPIDDNKQILQSPKIKNSGRYRIFDFCLLLLNKNYSADEFVHYLKECADAKPFLNKCKRIANREYFFSLPKSVITNYTFDLIKFKAVSKRIEEIKNLL